MRRCRRVAIPIRIILARRETAQPPKPKAPAAATTTATTAPGLTDERFNVTMIWSISFPPRALFDNVVQVGDLLEPLDDGRSSVPVSYLRHPPPDRTSPSLQLAGLAAANDHVRDGKQIGLHNGVCKISGTRWTVNAPAKRTKTKRGCSVVVKRSHSSSPRLRSRLQGFLRIPRSSGSGSSQRSGCPRCFNCWKRLSGTGGSMPSPRCQRRSLRINPAVVGRVCGWCSSATSFTRMAIARSRA
jgi:hypothetical protein